MINEIKAVLEKYKEHIPMFALAELLAVLDEAEEKHIGKRPLAHKCPYCNKIVFFIENYCPECGQKLDWGDEVD